MDINKYLLDYYIAQNGETITPELAEMLVGEMAVTDGSDRTNGIKWDLNLCKDLGVKAGVDFEEVDPAEWFVVMNMFYSDYNNVMRKYGHNDYTIYVDLSKAWFADVDGTENKTFRYFLT